MKRVLKLTDQECAELNELYKSGDTNRVRRRSHIVLLSNNNNSIREICNIFGIHRDTVSSTINCYNELGTEGLFDKSR